MKASRESSQRDNDFIYYEVFLDEMLSESNDPQEPE